MPPTHISHYQITRKIGAGTYGEVYEGVHVHDPELKVAIKRVTQALAEDPHFVESLKKECRQLDRMDHPNIVRFRELVVSDLGVSMVLELLEGQDLHDRLAGGPIALETTLDVIEAMLEGLAYAHARGVMHRDIKPSNVYCCGNGCIKLLDFGIARAADGTQATKTGHIVGTLDYMAPERFDARGGNLASDVYAVGLIAWELLAGRAACPDGEFRHKLAWHLTQGVGDAAKVAATLRGCPPWFAEVIALLAAKLPQERPTDGAAALALFRAKRRGGDARQPPTMMEPYFSMSPAHPSASTSWIVLGVLLLGIIALLLVGGLLLIFILEWRPTPIIPKEAPAVVIPSLPSLESPTLGKMVCLPGGKFQMGSPNSEVYRRNDETQHWVAVSSFCVMESEVTQEAWQAVMGSNPSYFSSCGIDCPVEQVDLNTVQDFVQKVSARDHVQYRLPTEAEWEYAARGGQSFLYSGADDLAAVSWYDGNSDDKTHPICQKQRNAYSLCDMSGNVWEWVSDYYGDYNTSGGTFDPQGNASNTVRVFRGGSWGDDVDVRVAFRGVTVSTNRNRGIGFRLVTLPLNAL